MISLNVIGFYLARANKSKVLAKIQANTMNELRAAVGRSRMYIIPQTSITLPLEVSFCCYNTPFEYYHMYNSYSSGSLFFHPDVRS